MKSQKAVRKSRKGKLVHRQEFKGSQRDAASRVIPGYNLPYKWGIKAT